MAKKKVNPASEKKNDTGSPAGDIYNIDATQTVSGKAKVKEPTLIKFSRDVGNIVFNINQRSKPIQIVLLIVFAGLVLVIALLTINFVSARINAKDLFPKAQEGETLFIVFPYAGDLEDAGYSPERLVFDVLQERVNRMAFLDDTVRLEQWDEPVRTVGQVREIGEKYHATLVIWGEYDDVVGVRTNVELLIDVPMPDAHISGDISPLASLESAEENQMTVGFYSVECLRDGISNTARYITPLSLGIMDVVQRDFVMAEKLFTESIDLLSDDASGTSCLPDPSLAYSWRGLTYSLLQDYQTALLDFDEAIRLGVDTPKVFAQRATAYLSLGNFLAARNDYSTALDKLYPEDQGGKAALWGNIGLTYEMEGDTLQAKAYYEKALKINSEKGLNSAIALDNLHLGNLALQQERFSLAADYFQTADAVYQKDGNSRGHALVLSSQGLLAYQQGNYEAARTAFESAHDIFYGLDDLLGQALQKRYLGQLAFVEGQYEEALNFYQASLTLCEHAGSAYCAAYAYIGFGIIHNAQGNLSTAIQDWEQAVLFLKSVNSPDALIIEGFIQGLAGRE